MDELGLTLQPMVHVRDLAGTVAALRVLGAELTQGSGEGDWAQLRVGGAEVGLLAHPPNPAQGEGDVELNFRCAASLDRVEERARAAGVEIARPTSAQPFGRQLQLRTPDGLLIKINEIDDDLVADA